MGKTPFKPLRYKCPICGKHATFGTHHCEVKPEAGEEKPPSAFATRLRYALSALVALLLIVAFLWEMIGTLSLLAVVLLPVGLFLVWIVRRLLPSSSFAEYRSLVRMACGDKEAAERLIAAEAIKHPGKPRKDLIKNLLVQWRRDLR